MRKQGTLDVLTLGGRVEARRRDVCPDTKLLGDRDVEAFLKAALAEGPVPVGDIEVRARAAGLLGERQRITNARRFKHAKSTLGIGSVRHGFGRSGVWLWALPPPAAVPAPEAESHGDAVTGMLPKFRGVLGVPPIWLEGVARLQDLRNPRDVPPHRWQQFALDCYRFILSTWAQRAAGLGWDAIALFGCTRSNPLMYPQHAGLIWLVGGGCLVRLTIDTAEIQPAADGPRRTYHRRRVDAALVTLPWRLR